MKQIWFQTLTRTSALAYARVIATSENDGDLFAKVVAPSRLRVIENGVDVEKYAGQGARAPGRTMLYFGRWSVNKGLIETLELLQAALTRDPQWRLIIAGREYDLNEADLRKAIAERGLQDKVQLSMSPSQQQLCALMQQAQFFVCLSRHEGFGIAAVEAMSAGLIPILSDIPPFVRLATESGQGVIVNRDRIQAAADSVQALALQANADFDAPHGDHGVCGALRLAARGGALYRRVPRCAGNTTYAGGRAMSASASLPVTRAAAAPRITVLFSTEKPNANTNPYLTQLYDALPDAVQPRFFRCARRCCRATTCCICTGRNICCAIPARWARWPSRPALPCC